MRYEALRLLCFFDLPMESKDEKRIYRNFRKELISNGFANKFYKKLKMSNLPAGNVRLLAVTEKQFSEMTLIIGGKTKQEEIVSDNKLVVI